MEMEGLEPKASVPLLAQEKPKTGTEREDHLFLIAAQRASQGCKCPGASAHRLLMGGGGREPLSTQMPLRPQQALTGTSLVTQWLGTHLPVQGKQVRSKAWGDATCCRGTKPVHPSPEAHVS